MVQSSRLHKPQSNDSATVLQTTNDPPSWRFNNQDINHHHTTLCDDLSTLPILFRTIMKLNTLFLLLAASMSASAFVAPRQSTTTTSNTGLFDAKDVSALTKDLTTIFSSEDIDKILPHRYPFALVDKVIEYEAGKVR
jgi:hypothetical protein